MGVLLIYVYIYYLCTVFSEMGEGVKSLETGVQMVVSYLWMLGIEPRSTGNAHYALKHQAISLASRILLSMN